jgi:uncharacterized protein YndB with AHSA1/START domain
MERVEVERVIPQPIERVFDRYTDHAGWSDWAGVGKVRLVQEGAPDRNGVGAVRAFASTPGLREEVVLFERPSRMEYRVTAGPVPMKDHLGEVMFAREGENATRLTWRVSFRSKIPGIGWLIARGLGVLFRRMLSGLERDLARG